MDCWHENGGCTTYGCARSPSSSPLAHAASQAAHPPPPPYSPTYPGAYRATRPHVDRSVAAVMAGELDRNAANALMCALIGFACCPVVAIVGFFMGSAVFSGLSRMGIDSRSARQKAVWAVVLGALGPVIWTAGFLASAKGGGAYR